MSDPSITFFPVGNGDTTLIKLSDGSTLIIDCNIRCDANNEDVDECYDVHSHLLGEVQRDDKKRPFTDVFMLGHADQDHCRGFETSFHTGAPGSYQKEEDKPEKIIIAEIWFSRRLFSNYEEPLCDEAKAFKKEVERRIELYKKKDAKRDLPGNRLRVTGYGESEEMEGLEEITTLPGNSINLINGAVKDDFSLLVHAPFKRTEGDEDVEKRNNTSMVFQASFNVDGVERACLVLLGGDATWDVWRAILRKAAESGLQWDILLAPHHCSWSFFNNTPHADNKEPTASSLKVLAHHREGAVVVASSKPIKDDDFNPPHYAAKQEYVKVVGEQKFYCVGEIPSEEKPEPLLFTMSSAGPVRDQSTTPSQVRAASAVAATLRTPTTYG